MRLVASMEEETLPDIAKQLEKHRSLFDHLSRTHKFVLSRYDRKYTNKTMNHLNSVMVFDCFTGALLELGKKTTTTVHYITFWSAPFIQWKTTPNFIKTMSMTSISLNVT